MIVILAQALLCLAMNVSAAPGAGTDDAGAEVPHFSTLTLSGNAETAPFRQVGQVYNTYVRLRRGTFALEGETAAGRVRLSAGEGGSFSVVAGGGEARPFAVKDDCVACVTVDPARGVVHVMPVVLNVRGAVAPDSPMLQYAGNGIWRSEVTLTGNESQQWVDKTMHFTVNNSDAYPIRRLCGAPSRFTLGIESGARRTEEILQNAGTYTVTVDLRADTFAVSAPVDENRISVFGSSVANGQGAEGFRGYRYLYGEHLKERHASGLSADGFYTSNVSIGGNTTTALLGRYDDLTRDFGRYVIFGLSLGNEGIHGAADPEAVFGQWRDNMLRLISMARVDGKIPVVMNNYTRGDFTPGDYDYVKRLNLLIHEWPVPSFNCLGAIDDGRGHWADGYEADTYHQNTEGHFEFFTSMVPSLFDALRAGKSLPERRAAEGRKIGRKERVAFRPEGTCHPFTLSARVSKASGSLMRLSLEGGTATVAVSADGTLLLRTPEGRTLLSAEGALSAGEHYVTLTTYYAQRRTLLYVDSLCVGEVPERLGRLVEASVAEGSCRLRELMFWRSGMTPEEIAAVCEGRMLKSSLEIYAPMEKGKAPVNLAQSTNVVAVTRLSASSYDAGDGAHGQRGTVRTVRVVEPVGPKPSLVRLKGDLSKGGSAIRRQTRRSLRHSGLNRKERRLVRKLMRNAVREYEKL